MRLLSRFSKLDRSFSIAKIKLYPLLTSILLLTSLITTAETTFATEYYIAPSECVDNEWAGKNEAQPWCTFEYAMGELDEGDTLYLMDGDYYQSLDVTVSGTSNSPISIKAQNDGKAIVHGDNVRIPLKVAEKNWVIIDGIQFIDGKDDQGRTAYLEGKGITLRRISIHDPTGAEDYQEVHFICQATVAAEGCLMEDSIVTGIWGRVNTLGSQYNTLRRNYFRGGSAGPYLYQSNNCLVENNITTISANHIGTIDPGMTTHQNSGASSHNKFFGNVSFGNATGSTHYQGFGVLVHPDKYQNYYQNVGNQFIDNVAINPNLCGGKFAGDNNLLVMNNTVVWTNSDNSFSSLRFVKEEGAPAAPALTIFATVKNNSMLGNGHGTGLLVGDATITNTYNNYYNLATLRSDGVSLGTGEISVDASYPIGYGSGAFLMVPPNLRQMGESGSDIGAEVLYRYQNGLLTSERLWPWEMEERICKETGYSATWENPINCKKDGTNESYGGGIWKTLDHVYDYTMTASPSRLNFSSTEGNPPDQTITLSNSGEWTATADSTPPAWLSVSPTSGTGNATLTVSVNTAGLAPGTYTKTITLSDPALNSPRTVHVTLTNFLYAINSGGEQYADLSGVLYQADTKFTGGSKVSTASAITGTSDDTLYQSERYGNFSYNIPLANGNYSVTLKFAEIYWTAVGQRIFNVSMQGTQVISNLDIFLKVGKNAAYDVTVPVSVTNGTLNIVFSSVADYAKVSAIVITPSQAPSLSTIALSRTSLTFNATTGINPADQTIELSNSGGGTLNWTATADATAPAWLSVSPASGTSNANLIVSVNTAGLTQGTYTKVVTVSDSGATNTPQTVNVTLTVNQTSNVVFSTNSGGAQYTDLSGVVYKADTGYSGGYTASTADAISGTSDDTLYQSERYGNFSYNIPLANGDYTVTLKFAEIYWTLPGKRVFNVSMQSTQVISGLDIYSKVGKNAAYDVTFPVNVTNGTLNINFSSVSDYAKVSAIEITGGQLSPPPPPPAGSIVFTANAGGGQFTDSTGVIYQGDTGYSDSYTASTADAISGTSDDTLYQSERYGNFSYNIPLANGNYSVTLKFAEIYWTAAGQRKFNVSMQGTEVISNLDIFSKVGKNAAYDVNVPASVTNGTLNINFSSVSDYAKVSAIVVTATD